MKEILAVLKLPKSVYYYWIKHMDDQEQKDQWLVEKIKEIVSKHKGRYGYRRIKAILENREHVVVNHKRLLRIMKTYNLLCQKFKNKSRTRYSSYKGTVGKIAPNSVNRKFSPKTFNQLWVTDITEFALPIKGKKLYLSTIMDCYNSEIIAYKVSRSPSLDIAIQPLKQAFERHRNDLNQLMVHSDQGFHYQHSSWGNT
ncbi:IS3 family transposase, partial [Nosocomiicoccus sp. HMSC09A07]|uniref:IS3 family transposase n=1 Tax=Nosocomiicoccus sp. HMSC09A07 TaxID=1581145 RepID=UPI00352CE3E4